MRDSPILAEYHSLAMPRPASITARPATATARVTTTLVLWARIPLSMTVRSSNGFATVITASAPVISRKRHNWRRYGAAWAAILRTVPGVTFCWSTEASRRKDHMMRASLELMTARPPVRAALRCGVGPKSGYSLLYQRFLFYYHAMAYPSRQGGR